MTLTRPYKQHGTTITDAVTGDIVARFDVTLEEDYKRDAKVSAYPREEGPPISDGHQAQQRRFSMTGDITNTPLVQETTMQDRASYYFEVIDALISTGRRVTVSAGMYTYENTVLTTYSSKRDARSGQVLSVTLDFIQVEIVQSATVEVPAVILAAVRKASGTSKKRKDDGKKTATAAQEASVNRSLLKRGAKLLGF